MTHYDAETLDEITYEELTSAYDTYLDDSGEYGVNIEGVELAPSDVLKTVDPIAYDECLNNYINSLYDAGELTSQWDREDRIKELCSDWAFDTFGVALDYTTMAEDETIYKTLFDLYGRGVFELDSGEIVLSDQGTMAEILIALGTALNENKNN